MNTPTHRCKICNAHWCKHHDGTWSLVSPVAGKCCDNAPMGDQIEAMNPTPDPRPFFPIDDPEHPAPRDQWIETRCVHYQEPKRVAWNASLDSFVDEDGFVLKHCGTTEWREILPSTQSETETPRTDAEFNFVTALTVARQRVDQSVLWRKFIDGTPLANDVPVWIAEGYMEGADFARALEKENAELRKALEAVTGKEADGVAHDLDHGNFYRNPWWRAVEKARALLSTGGRA